MTIITSLKAKHIKGIEEVEISCRLVPNQPNFLVAPNGSGKSSLAIGFESLKRTGLKLTEGSLYEGKKWPDSELGLTLEDGTYLGATSDKNEIARCFDVAVIRGGLYAKQSVKQFNGHAFGKAKVCLPDVVLSGKIPEKAELGYSIRDMRDECPASLGKLLFNFSNLLTTAPFLEKVMGGNCFFEDCSGSRNSARIEAFMGNLEAAGTTKQEMLEAEVDCSGVEQIKSIKEIADLIADDLNSQARHYCLFNAVQLNRFCASRKSPLKKALKRAQFEKMEQDCESLLHAVNATRLKIGLQQEKGKLVLKLPDRSQVSNGELDVLYFAAAIVKARAQLSRDNAFLLIDEVFDYLDDGNLLVAQYYLLEMMHEFKSQGKNLYPVICTHIDPSAMSSYRFRTKHVFYFGKEARSKISPHMAALLCDRKRTQKECETIYNEISGKCLHYSPCGSFSEETRGYLISKKVPADMVLPPGFARAVSDELAAYLAGDEYDAAKVCCALRRHIEQSAFLQLSGECKQEFLAKNGTEKRLEYAEAEGASAPEVHYLLGSVYNSCMHLDKEHNEEPLVYRKLNNRVIQSMIRTSVEDA